jgi:hypothetical protein
MRQDSRTLPAKIHPNNPTAQRILAQAMKAGRLLLGDACGRGCSIKANYQSTTVHLPPALASGNLDILSDAMVREVTMDDAGKATGVAFIDKTTGREMRVKARIVLAASACESVRVLLNSKSARLPRRGGELQRQGGQIHHGYGGRPSERARSRRWRTCRRTTRTAPAAGTCTCRGGSTRSSIAGKLGFARGYHIEFGSAAARCPAWARHERTRLAQWRHLRQSLQGGRPPLLRLLHGFAGRGEMIPNEDSFCELDPTVKDKWGIPVLRFHWKWSEHETRQAAHMQQTFAELISAMGGRVRQAPEKDGAKAIEPAAASSTRSAAPSWAPTPASPSPTSGARPGT